jgi:ABC-type branched-subunit amino acid transport system ATPase component
VSELQNAGSISPDSDSDPLLAVRDLNAYYGQAHVLQDVSFELRGEPLAIIGRNGMGKTTLCAAIMSIKPPDATGSVCFRGKELLGQPSYKIANQGIGYVPQGRRLFPSLSVDEHLRMISRRNGAGGFTSCSHVSPSESGTGVPSSLGASSRCSRLAVHSFSIRRC